MQKRTQVGHQRVINDKANSFDLPTVTEADGFDLRFEIVKRAGKNQLVHLGSGQASVVAERAGLGQADKFRPHTRLPRSNRGS